MADLDAASLADVKQFFKTYYTPNNATLVIGGDIDPAAARRLVERYFGDVPRGPEVKRATPPAFSLSNDVYGTLEDRVQLPRVYNTWHTVRAFSPDDASLSALTQILAGGKTSRLYKRLVYELQIANQVVAFQDGGRLDGKVEIFATAKPGHPLDELQKVIDEEVRRSPSRVPPIVSSSASRTAARPTSSAAWSASAGSAARPTSSTTTTTSSGRPTTFSRTWIAR